jgi:hypothetical protein
MAMGRDLMVNQPAATASEAHELVSEAGEAIRANQRTIKAALRGLGVASDMSETSSLGVPPRLPWEDYYGEPRGPCLAPVGQAPAGRAPQDGPSGDRG